MFMQIIYKVILKNDKNSLELYIVPNSYTL